MSRRVVPVLLSLLLAAGAGFLWWRDRAPDTGDVLRRILLPDHAVGGRFRRDSNGRLLTPPDLFSRVRLPVDPPEAYDLEIRVERLRPKGSLNIGLSRGAARFMAVLDGMTPPTSGLDLVGGTPFHENETASPGSRLPVDTDVRVVCSVRPSRISVTVDGTTVIDWTGGNERLSRFSRWEDGAPLYVGSFGAEFRISEIRIRPASTHTS